MDSKLQAFLASVVCIDDFKLVPLRGTGTNQHFALTNLKSHKNKSERQKSQHQTIDFEHDYFLKVFVTNSLQIVNRHEQFQIQRQLAQQDVAPQPIALSECQTYWLEQWCATNDLALTTSPHTPGYLSDSTIKKLANTLVKIHQCNVQAHTLDLSAEWERYIAISNLKMESRLRSFLEVLKENWHSSDLCFCHNDLHYSHILQLAPVRVVDWEYAAIGNRYFDIAACARVNHMNDQQLSRFIEQYSLKIGIPRAKVQEGIQLMLPMVDFTNELWHNAYNQIT